MWHDIGRFQSGLQLIINKMVRLEMNALKVSKRVLKSRYVKTACHMTRDGSDDDSTRDNATQWHGGRGLGDRGSPR